MKSELKSLNKFQRIITICKVVLSVAGTRHVNIWLIVSDPLTNDLGLLLPDISNIWIVIVMWHSQIKLILCISHYICGDIQVLNEFCNSTRNPWVTCSIREDNIGILFQIKSLILSSKLIKGPSIIRHNTMLNLAIFSEGILINR